MLLSRLPKTVRCTLGWLLLAVALAAGATGSETAAGVVNRDAAASLVELDRAYVQAWKEHGTARQAAALLPLFAEDATILPGGGLAPRHGHAEIRGFWFPEGAPPTAVRTFEHEVLGVEVEGGLGVLHGRAELEFEYDGTEVVQEGNYLLTARRQADGEWRITRLIWSNRTLP